MAITTDPTYPVAGDEIELSITGATGTTTATRFELTSVPDRSALETGELVDAAGDPVQVFTADAAGAYGIRAFDYRRYSGGAAYPGDPAGEAREHLVAVQTGSVYVVDEMLLPIAGAGHSLTLRWVTSNATVVEASLVSPTTEKARQCALDATVLAAVAALEGAAASGIGENLITDVVAFIAAFNAHLDNAPPHYISDEVNQLVVSNIVTQVGAIAAMSTLEDKMFMHFTDTSGVWHHNVDGSNYSITPKSTSVAGVTVKLADLRRIYAAHIATTTDTMHQSADTLHVITADSALTAAIRAVLTFFAAQAPSTPTGESAATTIAVAKHGFKLA